MLKHEELYDKWQKFINDPKYSHLFIEKNVNDIWICNLKNTKEYIDKYEKRPTKNSNKQLAGWIQNNRTKLINNTGIMRNNPEIRKIWEDFITSPDCSKFF